MSDSIVVLKENGSQAAMSRRRFFSRAGVGSAAAILIAGCDSASIDDTEGVVLDFSDDFGVLNYAYALEQLEAAFYDAVLTGGYYQGLGSGSEERQILMDIRDHEFAHVDFFRAALGSNAIGDLTPNFSAVDFSSRASVLGTAKVFEDLGVSAYNGAGR